MAKFTNDLAPYIDVIQYEEIIDSMNEKIRRQSKETLVKTGIITGAVVVSSAVGIYYHNPLAILITLGSAALTNSLYNLYIQQKHLKKYQINFDNIDYRELAKSQREKSRYKGELKHKSSYSYEIDNPEYIEEEFGYSSDNDLPVQFLEQHLVPERVLREYNLYSKRYNVPTLNISEEDLVDFIDKLSDLLKKVNMSHRIYFYTSEYFRRLISKGIINYWDEITLETLLSNLEVFQNLELTEADIHEFINSFSKEENSKKLK